MEKYPNPEQSYDSQELLREGILAGSLYIFNFFSSTNPLLGAGVNLAAAIGTDWTTSVIQKTYEHLFVGEGEKVIDEDIARALSKAFVLTVDKLQLNQGWVDSRNYKVLERTKPNEAQATIVFLEELSSSIPESILSMDEAILEQEFLVSIPTEKDKIHEYANNLLKERFGIYLDALGVKDFEKYIGERTTNFGTMWLENLRLVLREPDVIGTRAWRASQTIWNESTIYAIQVSQQRIIEGVYNNYDNLGEIITQLNEQKSIQESIQQEIVLTDVGQVLPYGSEGIKAVTIQIKEYFAPGSNPTFVQGNVIHGNQINVKGDHYDKMDVKGDLYIGGGRKKRRKDEDSEEEEG